MATATTQSIVEVVKAALKDKSLTQAEVNDATYTKEEILQLVSANLLPMPIALAKLDAMSSVKPQGKLYMKVSEKAGALSLYGLQRMPVTLYPSQWERVLDMADDIRAFIKEHASEFKAKPAK